MTKIKTISNGWVICHATYKLNPMREFVEDGYKEIAFTYDLDERKECWEKVEKYLREIYGIKEREF